MYIEAASNIAQIVDPIMNLINWISIISIVLIMGTAIYFAIRYRRRGPNDITSRTEGSLLFETIWTAVPTLLCVMFFLLGLSSFRQMREAPENSMEIRVSSAQWAWEFQYPESVGGGKVLKSYNTLYLEENQPTKLIMKSQDVIHSFFVPAFRVKEDIVANIFTYVWFTPLISEEQAATGRGEYNIFCAEYCGRNHSAMIGKAVVLKPAAFKKQMDELDAESGVVDAASGKKIFDSNCKSCHTLTGIKLVGPSFKGLWSATRTLEDGTTVTADENYIRDSLLNPGKQVVKGFVNLMPPQALSEEQILSIIEFLKTVK